MIFLRSILFLIFALGVICKAHAAPEIETLQQSLDQGHADKVIEALNAALQNDSENPHLLYNRAVALYAAKKFDEALVDLDLVENSRFRSLANKARFQKGNAEFQLGLTQEKSDAESTVAHWKQSLANYKTLLKEQPGHDDAKKNHEKVRQLLLQLLLKLAQENLQRGQEPARPPEQRIAALRAAMEQFHDAREMDPPNETARQGEERARDLLADLLADEGTRKTLTNRMIFSAPNEGALPRPDIPQIQEGVNMLEDARDLKPQDKNIAEQLQQGRQRLADALTFQAGIYFNMEPQLQRFDEKQALLRMAMEALEKALEQVPDHQRAKELMEEVKKRLAAVHEQQGDQEMQQSENAEVEQQAQQLSQALDHFQQASDLQPQQSQLPVKAQQAQEKLENALGKLADKLMQQPGAESMEEAIARMEGALQALNELQGLKPSEQTAQNARQVGGQLEALRQMLAMSNKPGKGRNEKGSTQSQGDKETDAVITPMDAPPRFDTTGTRGKYRSSALNRSLRDY
ncbi:MAG: hypothetical protein ABJC04_08815 [Verrucomicrobiota bacterium]